MEVESEEVKPIIGGVEVEVEEKKVVEVKNNLGSAKEASDALVKNMVHHWTNGSRPASMPSVPNAMPTADQLTFFYGGKVFVFEAVPEEKVHEIMLIASAVKSGDINKTDSVPPASTPVLTRSPSLQSTASVLASTQPQLYPASTPVLTRSPSLQSTASVLPSTQPQLYPASTPVLTRSPSLQSTASVLPSTQPQLYPANTPVLTRSPSLCNFQAELPIARRHSLQRFLEKRRDRLVSKNPYPTPTGKTAETSKDINAKALPSPSCAEKSLAREDEIKIEVTGNIA